ncbi:YbjQ family protein [Tissierellaceae bacterium HCP3S3_D8]
MLITNLPDISGRDYEILGLVEGSAVYSKHFGKDLMAGFKNMVGGELVGYTEMLDGAKELSLDRLEREAVNMGADAILNMEYSITNLQGGSALVVNVIGTAIKFK